MFALLYFDCQTSRLKPDWSSCTQWVCLVLSSTVSSCLHICLLSHVHSYIDHGDRPSASGFFILSFDVFCSFAVTKWWSLPILLVKSFIFTLWEIPEGTALYKHPWWFMQCNQGGIADDEVIKLSGSTLPTEGIYDPLSFFIVRISTVPHNISENSLNNTVKCS